MPRPDPKSTAPTSSPPASGVESHIDDGDRLRVLDHVEGGIAVCQADKFLYANARLLRLLGFTTLEALAQNRVSAVVSEARHDGDPAKGFDTWAEATASGVPHPETWRAMNGSQLRVEVCVSKMELGGVAARVVLVRDQTSTVRAQAQLQQTERLATIGSLAAGVAHQLNNPLAYLLANVNFLAEEIPPFLRSLSPTVTEEQASQLNDMLGAMSDAREGAERVARIVRDLRTLSRMEDDRRELVDVTSAVESACVLVESELQNRARLVKVYETVLPVEGNHSRLTQVFLNVLLNAAQAIPPGSVQANEVSVHIFLDERDGMVTIEVADSGVGMSEAVLARIFDPFYTLKPVGEGTGLGLTTCLAIIHHLGGSISVESREGQGSRFRVKLPPGVRSVKRDTSTIPPSLERQRILIVDDELTLLSSLRRALAREVEVTIASSGKEALAVLAEHAFDLVLSDIMMPDMNGIEFYTRATAAHPELGSRFVLMTGGSITGSLQQSLDALQVPRLEKPFDIRELRRLLRRPSKAEEPRSPKKYLT